MKKQSTIMIILMMAFAKIFVSCNNEDQSSKYNSQLNEVKQETIEQPKIEQFEIKQPEVEIIGTYSGTDNLGMESTIILRSGGSMVTISSIGDGTPSVGEWSGDAENISLYIKSEEPYYDNYGNLNLGGNQLLGRGRITQEGLQIFGGKFYQRQ
jgi:hypothetical protein